MIHKQILWCIFAKIDCSPVDHAQLYAQLKAELLADRRYWFTSEEEAEIMASNQAFYKRPVEEEVFHACFRAAQTDERGLLLSSAEIFKRLKEYNPAAMRGTSATHFSKLLLAMGAERKHTRYGNCYSVVSLQ